MNEDPILNGMDADRLLSDPMYVRGKEAIRQACIEKWESLPLSTEKEVVQIHNELKAIVAVLAKLDGYFREVAQTGKFAAMRRDQEKNIMERTTEALANAFRRR